MPLQLSNREKLSIRFMSTTSKVLFVAIVVDLFLLIMFVRVADHRELSYRLNQTKLTAGYIDRVIETDYSANDRPILKYFFTFEVGGEIFQHYSYSSRFYYNPMEVVQIQYVVSDPKISRISGTKNGHFKMSSVLIPVLILIVLIIFSVRSYRKSQFIIDLLYNRVEDVGQCIRTTETSRIINDRHLYELEYEYMALEDPYITIVYTTTPEEYYDEEPLFYSKSKPEQAVLFKDLPKGILSKLSIEIG